LYDGEKVILYDGAGAVTIRDTSNPTSDYLFDPRLLGITTTYTWKGSLAKALPHQTALQSECIGREALPQGSAWHVRMIDVYKQQIDTWIDDSHGFRVYRYDFAIPDLYTNTTVSFYENRDYPWLPSRVETRSYQPKNGLRSERLITVLKAEANLPAPEKTWTIAGVSPPNGSPVSDLRVKKRMGYWNNGTLTSNPPPAPVPHALTPRTRALVVITFALVSMAFLFLALRYRAGR
jgi:hypothetical protein